jgi:transposase-like protein
MDQEGGPKRERAARQHDEEFKRSVVAHWKSSGKTAAAVAKEFGINVWNLRDWRHRYAPAPKGVDDPVPESPQEMRREIQQLRKELARTIHQREILKKTLGIISEV